MLKLNKNKTLRIIISLFSSILNIIRKEFIREKHKKPKRRRNGYDEFYPPGPPPNY